MNELTLVTNLMPALTLADAAERRNAVVEFTRQIMVAGTDYGEIPGTNKPTLLKPGAEKLCTHFGLTPTFERVDAVKDWTGKDFGEPLFAYEYRCKLWRGQHLVAEGIGSCNSWEKKYRYRDQQRLCPSCGQATIFKSKPRQGDPPGKPLGYYCWAKKGGCGAQFPAGDAAIEDQPIGQIANPDIFDLVNTIDKMAQKRALIAATLIGVNASEFFTQDIEDLHIIDIAPAPVAEPVGALPAPRQQPASGGAHYAPPPDDAPPPTEPEPAPAKTVNTARYIKRVRELWRELKAAGVEVSAQTLSLDLEAMSAGELTKYGKELRQQLDAAKLKNELADINASIEMQKGGA